MAWTFDVFSFIPVCILFIISTLVPQGFASTKPSCTACTGAGGQWCTKNYVILSPKVPVGASFCLPKGVKPEKCLGGDAGTACPGAPPEDPSTELTEPPTCAACHLKGGTWCAQPAAGGGTPAAASFCINKDKAAADCTGLTPNGVITATGTACPTDGSQTGTAVLGKQATQTTCKACVDIATNSWCTKDYGANKKSTYCVATDTVGGCPGGEKKAAPATTNCPPSVVDRRNTIGDISTCAECIDTYAQKWCIKGEAGPDQIRACVPTDKLDQCPLTGQTGTRQIPACGPLLEGEKTATPVVAAAAGGAGGAGAAGGATTLPPGNGTVVATTSDASTVGVLTGAVLSMLVATA